MFAFSTLMVESFGDRAFSHVADIVNAGVKNIELTWNIGIPLDDKKALLEGSKEILKTGVKIISEHSPLHDIDGKDLDISSFDNWDRKFAIREIQKSILAFRMLTQNNDGRIVVHCGRKFGSSRKPRIEKAIESLKEILDFVGEFGIEICLENTLPGDVGCYLEDLLLVKEKLNSGSRVKFCFDTGHYNLGRKQDDILAEMAKDISEIHLHDNNGKSDDHLAPGDGNIVWEDLFSKMKDCRGITVFELFESAPEVIEKCVKFAQESDIPVTSGVSY